MAKLELYFVRTEYDSLTAWTAYKTVVVEVPDEMLKYAGTENEWHLISGYGEMLKYAGTENEWHLISGKFLEKVD